MSDRSSEERNVRSLMHHASGAYQVTLPVEYVRELKWKGKQKLSVELRENEIIIRDWKK